MAHLFDLEAFQSWVDRLDRRASSAVVILEADDTALVVKTNYKTHWTFPGGFIDAGETPRQAAAREVSEEIGLQVSLDHIDFGWVIARKSSVADTYQFVFRARLSPGMTDSIILQASEIDAYKLVAKQEVLSDPKQYSRAAIAWASDYAGGYDEQIFDI